MARRSREDMELQRQRMEQEVVTIGLFSTAIYARLSVENSGKSSEKDVISNQIELCKGFISEKEDLALSNTYIDNGVTGTHFQRKGLQNLLRDIEEAKINCVVVRDFSRFGRNRMECIRYLSKVFPELGVRFISIADGYDSQTCDHTALNVLVQNMLNEYYSHDTSKKVHTALRIQMQEGTFKKRNLPYGYMWSEDRESMIVDEEVADFVKMIFRMKLEGISYTLIMKKLDELQAPLPEVRKVENGVRVSASNSAKQWAKSTINGIITNPHYVGDTVLGRSESAIYQGIKTQKEQDESKWFVFPDTHPALVSREDFKIIQDNLAQGSKIFQEKQQESKEQRAKMIDLFHGKIFCGDCGRVMYFKKQKMVYRGVKSDNVHWYSNYNCSTSVRRLTPSCTPHQLQQKVLERQVLDTIKTQVKVALNYETLLDKLRNTTADKSIRERQTNLIRSYSLKVNNLKQKSHRLYEDYTAGILDQEEYLFTKEAFHKELTSFSLRLEEAIERKEEFAQAMSSNNKWITLMKSVSRAKKLNQSLVDTVIEKILVFEDNRLEIVMKYEDIFLAMVGAVEETEHEVDNG